jgi:hypothetical protein
MVALATESGMPKIKFDNEKVHAGKKRRSRCL